MKGLPPRHARAFATVTQICADHVRKPPWRRMSGSAFAAKRRMMKITE